MQTAIIPGIIAVSFYLAALILQAMTVITRRDRNSKVFLFGALAVLFHGFNVYGVIRANDGYQFGFFEISTLIAFSIITETVFQWPGMGFLFIQAVQFVDIPIMSAYLVFIAFVFVMINFIVDILYYFIDPRIRVKGDSVSG